MPKASFKSYSFPSSVKNLSSDFRNRWDKLILAESRHCIVGIGAVTMQGSRDRVGRGSEAGGGEGGEGCKPISFRPIIRLVDNNHCVHVLAKLFRP